MNPKALKTLSRPNTVINKVNKVINKVHKVYTVRDNVPHKAINIEICESSNDPVIPPPPTERERVKQVSFLKNLI